MPKRTNDFQALIALVERQLAASGVRVVESEMLADRLTGELREVDVCVHAIVSGKEVTLALECRDHKRKADQIWIDTLRGKYANLPVDKVIAVARAGFAKTARAAAEKARIQTLTLEEATSANWHLIAELPDAALVVAHFPVAENVSLHLVKGQQPIPDTMMVADGSLRLGDQTLPLTYTRGEEEAHFVFSMLQQGDETSAAAGSGDAVQYRCRTSAKPARFRKLSNQLRKSSSAASHIPFSLSHLQLLASLRRDPVTAGGAPRSEPTNFGLVLLPFGLDSRRYPRALPFSCLPVDWPAPGLAAPRHASATSSHGTSFGIWA